MMSTKCLLNGVVRYLERHFLIWDKAVAEAQQQQNILDDSCMSNEKRGRRIKIGKILKKKK